MPYVTWSTNDVPTASQFNANFRDQVISTVTSGTRPSGTEGQFIYETDTDRVYIYTGSAWEQVGRFGGLDNWTPNVTQSGAVTATVTEAKYQKTGRCVEAYFILAITAAGTSNNAITINAPPFSAIAATIGLPVGNAYWNDSGAGNYAAQLVVASATSFVLRDTAVAPSLSLGLTGSANGAALANGDQLWGSFTYYTQS